MRIWSDVCTFWSETTPFHSHSQCSSALHHDWCKPPSWQNCLCIRSHSLFLFRAMLYTHAGRYGKVRTLWICTPLFAVTMQMTIPMIAMFHRFSLASFMQAVHINHDYVWCFDYVGCSVFGGCGMWLWRNIAVCSLQYKVTQSRKGDGWGRGQLSICCDQFNVNIIIY